MTKHLLYNCCMIERQYLTIRLTEKRKRWIDFLAKRMNLSAQDNASDVVDFALAFTVLLASQFAPRKEKIENE